MIRTITTVMTAMVDERRKQFKESECIHCLYQIYLSIRAFFGQTLAACLILSEAAKNTR